MRFFIVQSEDTKEASVQPLVYRKKGVWTQRVEVTKALYPSREALLVIHTEAEPPGPDESLA